MTNQDKAKVFGWSVIVLCLAWGLGLGIGYNLYSGRVVKVDRFADQSPYRHPYYNEGCRVLYYRDDIHQGFTIVTRADKPRVGFLSHNTQTWRIIKPWCHDWYYDWATSQWLNELEVEAGK